MTVVVADVVNNGISLTADFPSLSGDPGTAFTYNLKVTNDTPIEQTFTFDPTAPQGWEVTASPTAQAKAQTVTVDAGADTTVNVSATPPATAQQGSYPIDVTVTGANGATGTIELEAVVQGTPQLALGTADQRLNVSGKANTEKRVPMIIANSGTAPLESVKLAGTAPTGWEVSFDPAEVAAVQPGETAQVAAIIKPAVRRRRRRLHDDRAGQRRQPVVERRPALHARGIAHARHRGDRRDRGRLHPARRRVRQVRQAVTRR